MVALGVGAVLGCEGVEVGACVVGGAVGVQLLLLEPQSWWLARR